ncbi:SHOCT domain-containing protein [Nocardioides cynanchi]|uniref:SHOCT domain-containing protein n=1 Tax=Nocardioides cynanchi TaxID=2558918 RepID=UPI00192E2BB7|nr:SHOCT domain-containing protein [Nocardioides cynanchi]
MARKRDDSDLSGLRPDLAAAAGRLGTRLRDPGELAPVAAYLSDDETVRYVVLGTHERGGGVLVLTDRRLLFFLRRVMTPTLDLRLGAISSVTTSSGFSTGEVAMDVGKDVVAVTRITRVDLEPLAHAIRRAVLAAPGEPEAAEGASGTDPFEAMEKLAHLRDTGVLTEAEFAAKKQELLDRL